MNTTGRRYPKRRTIYVDVDGTLMINDKPNDCLISRLIDLKTDGFTLVLWSARGGDHAKRVAARFGVSDMFVAILDKPGYIVDDKGVSWLSYVGRIPVVVGDQ